MEIGWRLCSFLAGYALDTYPNQIEVITAEQMMDAYASVGMPLGYHHWSYGKHFLSTEKSYSRGQMGLAYEIVINSDPCIAYLMEENTISAWQESSRSSTASIPWRSSHCMMYCLANTR